MACVASLDSRTIASMMFLLCFSLGSLMRGQEPVVVAPPSKTDTLAEDESGHKIRVQRGELAKVNFQIAGIDLAAYKEALDQAADSLGKTATHASGDASTALEEACYQSSNLKDRTLLIVQRGEVSPSFVLAADRSYWKWNTPCRRSAKVTRQVSTASGLRLGLSEEQVIAVLGLPTSRIQNHKLHSDSISYDFEMRKRTNQTWLMRSRREHPEMSERELGQNYGHYDLWESINAKFVNDSLVTLVVNWSATS
jgi:hypothetical protein